MILSGKQILKEMETGNIKITPFNINQLNPNSYNLKLANELLVYDIPMNECFTCADGGFVRDYCFFTQPLDMRKENHTRKIEIPEEGFILYPGILYLGRTVEFTETHNFIPCVEGRSSIGRLGVNIHITAGLGQVGFAGHWVLELSVIQPVRIYPNIEICQTYYHEIKGEIEEYNGKYQTQNKIISSMIHMDEECK